ncbi:MAG: hypothetical protein ACYC54_13500 [Sedimentisphaerales bacterium]
MKKVVFCLDYGMEIVLSNNAGTFEGNTENYKKFYEIIFDSCGSKRLLKKNKDVPMLGLTEHLCDSKNAICVGTNYSNSNISTDIRLNSPVEHVEVLAGGGIFDSGKIRVNINPGHGVVVKITRY